MTQLGKKVEVSDPQPFNLDNELMRVFDELANTDPRTDQFRSLKVLILYQAQMIEGIYRMMEAQLSKKES